MFAKSPFKPLRDHMDKVVESVAPLKDFFDALHQGNYSKVEEIQQQIRRTCSCSYSGNCLPDWNASFNYSNCSWCRNGSRTGTRNWCPGFEGCRWNFHVMGYYTASRGPLVNFLLLLFSRSVSITRISRGRIK